MAPLDVDLRTASDPTDSPASLATEYSEEHRFRQGAQVAMISPDHYLIQICDMREHWG